MNGEVRDLQLLTEMNWRLSERLEINKMRAVPVLPSEDWRREMRMEWLIVSKAALRSRRMRMEREPESTKRRMSFVTFKRAVSVLCLERKPDWKGS